MNKFAALFLFLLTGCGGSGGGSTGAHEILGRWKTACFTDDPIDYWVTAEYVFTEDYARQIGFIYEDESCTIGIGNTDGGPSISEGSYFFIKSVVTSEGLTADIYGQYFLSGEASEVSELGVFIDNEILYLVHDNSGGFYVNFEVPFFKND